jgi:hypothetical protein
MEDNGDDLATWQWKPRKLVSASFSRLHSHRVRRHPIAVAALLAARLALAATRSAFSRAAASATKAALKHGLMAAPRQVVPNAIKWGPQVIVRAGQPSNPNDRKGCQERSETGRCYLRQGSENSWAKVLTSPDQDSGGGKATMGSDQYGVEVVHWPPLQRPENTKDGHPPAGPWSSQDGTLVKSSKDHGICDQVGRRPVHIASWRVQANKEQRLLENHLVKREGREGKKNKDDARLMDIYSFPGYLVEIEVPTNPDGSSKPVILDETLPG